ncbi:hypothetical protein TEA_007578 [Camellia sinensis var. sinensis]|uniref:HMA domain-containing protein n=1 Tax=Camellia sinensis var. sinensis TaxID=542762 RepID=A0A4S4DX34_CAMSN|nr:hypothetical protein TEA_007578 [Camellia sinensis var. sinensis]
MVPESEKPRVTEIQVWIDCNGCVQKIKKALHGISGIYDLYIDFPQQKLTIIGTTIRPTTGSANRATTGSTNRAASTSSGGSSTAEAVAPPAEQPKDPPPPENPRPAANDNSAGKPEQPSGPKDVKEDHVIYHHPPDYGYRYGLGHSYVEQWNNYPNGPRFQQEPSPQVYVSHSYNTYKPSPSVTHSYDAYKPLAHVTEYEYIRSPPQYTHYARAEHCSDDYHNNNNGNGNISSMFSDENPNACRVV